MTPQERSAPAGFFLFIADLIRARGDRAAPLRPDRWQQPTLDVERVQESSCSAVAAVLTGCVRFSGDPAGAKRRQGHRLQPVVRQATYGSKADQIVGLRRLLDCW